ncbi:MAG: hypothetical protein KA956_01945 [Pyrinomonadaceae bacterium]|nr:hypothetical protein [Acidobacteriota bacterium]MBK7935219.1 hypothetical protein [Acidobacteriota bacterium]MBP7375218.1 hypothetical protein [Pyrinomonadaceae bacterium]
MLLSRTITAIFTVFLFVSAVAAQKAEVTISLNEPFFDALLDSVFLNYEPPQFSIARVGSYDDAANSALSFFGYRGPSAESEPGFCTETVKILRENNGVRTAVRFRDGKVYVPLAFSGGYAPPFIGCVDFAGMAEADVDLEFDATTQRLVGRARVTNVNLNGTGGLGGTVIARLIQGSIDKKLNPIEILSLEKVSFGLPIPNTGPLKMKATGVRPEILNGSVQIRITYDFLKG